MSHPVLAILAVILGWLAIRWISRYRVVIV